MANEYLVKGESLTAVADKIRILNGTTETMSLDAMATNLGAANDEVDSQTELLAQAVAALEGKAGGGSEPSLQSKSVTPSAVQQTVVPDSDYDGLDKVTVAAIPSTYVKPTATKAATTYTPTTANQTIAAGTYCSGAQTIKGDANLVAGNIKSGVSIFGVAGSYEGSGSSGGGSVETCTVTLDCTSPINGTEKIFFTDGYSLKNETPADGLSTITVAKNSIIALYYISIGTIERNAELLSVGPTVAIFVSGDCTICW